jgi:hypothetical protein
VVNPPQVPPKKPNPWAPWILGGSLLALVVLVCLVGAVVGSGSGRKAEVKPPAGPAEAHPAAKVTKGEPKTFNVAVGSTIALADDDGAFEGTVRSMKTYAKACSEFFPDPKNGVFVIDVVVEQKKGTGSVNPLDFTFVAAFSGCDEPSLDSTNSLRAGQKRAGKIAFDATSAKGTVEWAPGGLGAESVGSWKVG